MGLAFDSVDAPMIQEDDIITSMLFPSFVASGAMRESTLEKDEISVQETMKEIPAMIKLMFTFSQALRSHSDYDLRTPNTITRAFKIGRNGPCPCGSGKKYKKCCLVHDVAANKLSA